MRQPTRAEQTNGLLFVSIPYGRLFHLAFPSFCHSSLYFVQSLKAPPPNPPLGVSLYVAGLSPERANKDGYSEWLPAGWIAALICSMQAAEWQQHMCWWQLLIGQTLMQHDLCYCTPAPWLQVYKTGLIHDENHHALLCLWPFGKCVFCVLFFEKKWKFEEHNVRT